MRMFSCAIFAGTLATMTALTPARAQDVEVPDYYPDDYAALIEAAKGEGSISVYGVMNSFQAEALHEAFTEKFGIEVVYNDLGTVGTFNRVISEAAAGQMGGDVVQSSALEMQMQLVSEGGHAATYHSPESDQLPEWANYEDMLYAITLEPVAMIYNTNALSADEIPATRPELISFLNENQEMLQGKVAAYDPQKSGTGFMIHTNDIRETDNFWDFAEALGANDLSTYSSSGAIKESVVSGENILAVNIPGSYGLAWAEESPNLGVAFGEDYTAAFSRTAFITKEAPHPNAAKVYLDFVLSQDGQSAIAAAGLPSPRTDVETGLNITTLNERVGGNLRPIAINEGLLEYMEPTARVEFFRQWNEATGQ